MSEQILQRSADAYRRIRNTARFMLSNLTGFNPATSSPSDHPFVLLESRVCSCSPYFCPKSTRAPSPLFTSTTGRRSPSSGRHRPTPAPPPLPLEPIHLPGSIFVTFGRHHAPCRRRPSPPQLDQSPARASPVPPLSSLWLTVGPTLLNQTIYC